MADRKETPDVLGEILAGSVPDAAPEATRPAAEELSPPAPPPPAARTTTGPKRRRKRASRVRWEYMEIVFRDYRGWRPRCINGAELDDWRHAPVIHEYLNDLGKDGWELVGIEKQRWYEKLAYFKRQTA